jgi:LmbE family N-acetylglucosaminyl deacetylase
VNRLYVTQLKDFIKTYFRPANLILTPRLVDRPPGNRVIVFSPHFDDDVIGCGGTLHKHARSGDELMIIYFTDGRQGDPTFQDKGQLMRKRKEEAIEATRILGIKRHLFLDEPETRLRPRKEIIHRLSGLLKDFEPNIIYLPFFLDNHIDHLEVNRIFMKLVKHLSIQPNIAAYEVWTPIQPNVIVDITEIAHVKMEALEKFKTQLPQVDYLNTTMALNRYRTISNMKGVGYAEGFLLSSWNDYIALLRDIRIDRKRFIPFGQDR